MERDLNEREKAGVPDAVLLEDFTNDNVFIENLEKRFGENIIYVRRDVMSRRVIVKSEWKLIAIYLQTYIGQVLISVNPYKELPIYSEDDVMAYRQKYFFENPPHA